MIKKEKRSDGIIKPSIIWQNDSMYIERRKPSLLNLFPSKLRAITLHEVTRWLVQYPFGYTVFTLNEKRKGEEIAYCAISNPGNFRYPFMSDKDVLVGPYYVENGYRGNHYAALLIEESLKTIDYENAWDFIAWDNEFSIRVSESLGFSYYADALYSKYLRILKPANDATHAFKLFVLRKED